MPCTVLFPARLYRRQKLSCLSYFLLRRPLTVPDLTNLTDPTRPNGRPDPIVGIHQFGMRQCHAGHLSVRNQRLNVGLLAIKAPEISKIIPPCRPNPRGLGPDADFLSSFSSSKFLAQTLNQKNRNATRCSPPYYYIPT